MSRGKRFSVKLGNIWGGEGRGAYCWCLLDREVVLRSCFLCFPGTCIAIVCFPCADSRRALGVTSLSLPPSLPPCLFPFVVGLAACAAPSSLGLLLLLPLLRLALLLLLLLLLLLYYSCFYYYNYHYYLGCCKRTEQSEMVLCDTLVSYLESTFMKEAPKVSRNQNNKIRSMSDVYFLVSAVFHFHLIRVFLRYKKHSWSVF